MSHIYLFLIPAIRFSHRDTQHLASGLRIYGRFDSSKFANFEQVRELISSLFRKKGLWNQFSRCLAPTRILLQIRSRISNTGMPKKGITV